MSNTYCSVFECKNSSSKTKQCDPQIKYYSFSTRPHQQLRMKLWISFVKRQSINGKPWVPTKWSKICSAHFLGNQKSEDPRSPSYNPSIRTPMDAQPSHKVKRYDRMLRRAKCVKSDEVQVEMPITEPDNTFVKMKQVSTKEMSCQTEPYDESESLDSFICAYVSGEEKMTQVNHLVTPTSIDKVHRPFDGFDSVKEDEKKLKDLTSVSFNTFNLLLSLIPKSTTRKNTLSAETRLLILLMKMKTNLTFLALGTLFGVSRKTISFTFHSLLDILYQRTINWIFWPSKYAVSKSMPETFKFNYPNCRVIIDCTELRTEEPPTVEQRVAMYSQYKSSYTVKYLIGITPNGLISFMSRGYGGRSTDTFITTNCGILDKLEYGDVVLADKGFPNLQLRDGIIFVMPPFSSSGQKQFSESQMNETYTVASVRIHVERVIQRLKIFNILSNRLSIDLLPNIDKIVHLCSALVNFQPRIIKNHE